MYSVMDYVSMVADGYRMEAYARAIERAVKPGAIVLDLGAGTGILSLLAAKAGARRVHAVEINPAVHLLRQLAVENDVADRIVVHPTSAFELQLTEKADVIVADLRGSFPLYGYHTEIIRDAKQRLLIPGGKIIPFEDRFFVSIVESAEIAHRLGRATEGFERRGLNAQCIRDSVMNTRFLDASLHPVNASDHLTTAECWQRVEYGSFAGGPLEGTVSLTARRTGVAHALAIWFAATVDDENQFTNEPGRWTVYARTILPLLSPVNVVRDDTAAVTVRVNEQGEQWAWDTVISSQTGEQKARFRQATFLGMPASPSTLLRASNTFVPRLSPRGEREKMLLSAIDGKKTVEDLTEQISLASPTLAKSQIGDEVRDTVSRVSV